MVPLSSELRQLLPDQCGRPRPAARVSDQWASATRTWFAMFCSPSWLGCSG